MGGLNLKTNSSKKLTIFITIDTEDSYFDVPRLITGEGLPGEPGLFKILDITEKYGFRGNIFLDVYSHPDFKPGVLEGIAKAIYDRKHTVELHSHPTKHLDFYKQNIFFYSLGDQIKILDYGKMLIHQWIGEYPLAYRGGSYAFNENTLSALDSIGIKIDSTRFYNHKNNMLQENFTVNRVSRFRNIVEVPVTYVKILKTNGDYVDSKFDIDALSINELIRVIQIAKSSGLRTLTLFLHSFSFINKKTKKASAEDDPKALFRAPSRGGSLKCEIYGTEEVDLAKYDQLLNYISLDREIEVLTLKEWYHRCSQFIDFGADIAPTVVRDTY